MTNTPQELARKATERIHEAGLLAVESEQDLASVEFLVLQTCFPQEQQAVCPGCRHPYHAAFECPEAERFTCACKYHQGEPPLAGCEFPQAPQSVGEGAPERIWIHPEKGYEGGYWRNPGGWLNHVSSVVEYVRADLARVSTPAVSEGELPIEVREILRGIYLPYETVQIISRRIGAALAAARVSVSPQQEQKKEENSMSDAGQISSTITEGNSAETPDALQYAPRFIKVWICVHCLAPRLYGSRLECPECGNHLHETAEYSRIEYKSIAPSPPDAWQDIETAPKDGTRILLWWPWWNAKHAILGAFNPHLRGGQWEAPEVKYHSGPQPQLWQPLPAPPSAPAEED